MTEIKLVLIPLPATSWGARRQLASAGYRLIRMFQGDSNWVCEVEAFTWEDAQ